MTDNAERIAVDLNPLLANGENGGAAAATLSLLAEIAKNGVCSQLEMASH